jgi:hypothetical protein
LLLIHDEENEDRRQGDHANYDRCQGRARYTAAITLGIVNCFSVNFLAPGAWCFDYDSAVLCFSLLISHVITPSGC